jgi:lysosomal acid lipase/cholesteryl ester hydrolase
VKSDIFFSFHEHGLYDAPAIIDKVLKVTGLSKISYVCYSMGCTTFFVMMSLRPEYNEKLVGLVGMAPAVYEDNVRPTVDFLVNKMDLPVRTWRLVMNHLYTVTFKLRVYKNMYVSK